MIIRSSRLAGLLQQDVVRDTDLANVVEQAAPLQGLELRIAYVHDTAHVDCDLLDPLAVPRGIRITLIDGLRQGANRLGEHVAHFDGSLRNLTGRIEREGEQQSGQRLDRIDDRHQPPKWSEGKAIEGSVLRIAREHRGKRLTGPKSE
jgi:hypothetical protein